MAKGMVVQWPTQRVCSRCGQWFRCGELLRRVDPLAGVYDLTPPSYVMPEPWEVQWHHDVCPSPPGTWLEYMR